MSRLARASCSIVLLLLAGCGMYGELYLEEEAPRGPEITEAPPIAVDEPATGGAANGAVDSTTPTREDEERDDGKREDDTAGAS